MLCSNTWIVNNLILNNRKCNSIGKFSSLLTRGVVVFKHKSLNDG